MVSYVDPATLKDEPLRLKRIADADYSVMVKDMRAGRIMATMTTDNTVVWLWTVTGPYVPADMPATGREDTLDAAKATFKARFEAWQEWAEKLGHDVVWHG